MARWRDFFSFIEAGERMVAWQSTEDVNLGFKFVPKIRQQWRVICQAALADILMEQTMKTILSLVVFGLAVAVTAPAFAQSKAECEKKGMVFDEKTKKCVKK